MPRILHVKKGPSNPAVILKSCMPQKTTDYTAALQGSRILNSHVFLFMFCSYPSRKFCNRSSTLPFVTQKESTFTYIRFSTDFPFTKGIFIFNSVYGINPLPISSWALMKWKIKLLLNFLVFPHYKHVLSGTVKNTFFNVSQHTQNLFNRITGYQFSSSHKTLGKCYP